MSVLCFDISSGGISAALLNSTLDPIRVAEDHWTLATDTEGKADLALETIVSQFRDTIRKLDLATAPGAIDALCIGSFMHNVVLLDADDAPISPVFTWLDSRGEAGIEYVRTRMGSRFHQRTGCRYHPMFPVFKLAAYREENNAVPAKARRIASVKSVLLHRLTGAWIEDHGMASAYGLYDIVDGAWSSELLALIGFDESRLPSVAGRTQIAGRVSRDASADFGLPVNLPVVLGSGDGFLAHLGSACDTPQRVSVSLGTSAAARQSLPAPALNLSSGTFCYKADEHTYLLGCAGSNGGNALDWGRSLFGTLMDADAAIEPPIFIPLLHGERSPDWNPNRTASWYGLSARHNSADLSRSILEGVVFNLAHYIEIIQDASQLALTNIILSGNGFLHPLAAPLLASVTSIPVRMPATPGLASLRGAGACALQALGSSVPPLKTSVVAPMEDARVLERYRQYRRLRK